MIFCLANLITDIGDSPAAVYPNVIVAALIATAGFILLHLLLSFSRGPRTHRPRWSLLTKLIYLGAIGSVVVLAGTSFYSVLAHGAMHGWFLFLHLFGAGAFVVFLLLIAVMWAVPSKLFSAPPAPADEPLDRQVTIDTIDVHPPSASRFHWIAKVAFWLMLISGVVTAGTMLVSMLPLLGTADMNQMITLHRYAGLVLVVATVVHLYTVLLSRAGRL